MGLLVLEAHVTTNGISTDIVATTIGIAILLDLKTRRGISAGAAPPKALYHRYECSDPAFAPKEGQHTNPHPDHQDQNGW